MSQWMLKSPEITSSEGSVFKRSIREVKSEMKAGNDKEGGRYIVRKV